MGNFTKVNLLIFCLAVILVSFIYSIDKPDTPDEDAVVTYVSTTLPYDFSSFKGFQLQNKTILYQLDETALEPIVKKQSIKKRKKLKRFVQVFSGIKLPVKEVDPAEFDIFWKNTYSKPYFLSHIHHFLFRLTPF